MYYYRPKNFWPKLAIPVIAFWGIFLLAIPIIRIIVFPGSLGTSCLFHSLAIFRLIDYFERLRNIIFCSTYAYLRLSMPSLWTYLGIVSVDERHPVPNPVQNVKNAKPNASSAWVPVSSLKEPAFTRPIIKTRLVEAIKKESSMVIPDPPIHPNLPIPPNHRIKARVLPQTLILFFLHQERIQKIFRFQESQKVSFLLFFCDHGTNRPHSVR